MPQISPMNWSIIILLFLWTFTTIFSSFYFEKSKLNFLSSVKSFDFKWNW